MGVKLTTLLEAYKKEITIKNLLNKTIAIDAFNFLYQFLASVRSYDGEPLKDIHGNVTSHLSGLLYRNLYFIENDVKPIWVFDGQPNLLKAEEVKRRSAIRELAVKEMENAQDNEDDAETKKYAQGTSRINTEMINESKELLGYLGIPFLNAPQDAEAQIGYMIQKNLVWGCASQDYDAFLFGADRIIRHLSVGDSKKLGIEYYALQACLTNLKLNREQLVDLAILIGVDFFEGIKGIGEKTAYSMITQYKNIEGIKQAKTKYHFDRLTPEFLAKIRNIFLKPTVTEKVEINRQKPNYEKITELLVEKHGFNKERIEKVIKRLKDKQIHQSQITIEDFLKNFKKK